MSRRNEISYLFCLSRSRHFESQMLTDIGVTHVFEEGNLSDGRARSAFLVFQPNLLEGHQVVRQPRLAFVDGGVRSL